MNEVINPDKQPIPAQSNMYVTRLVLRLNALSCLVFGLVFVLYTPLVSRFLGVFPELWLKVVGAGLLFHTAHLLYASMRSTLLRIEIFYFTAGDILWFLGSVVILVATDLIATSHGVNATLVVAILVLILGVAQLWSFTKRAIL